MIETVQAAETPKKPPLSLLPDVEIILAPRAEPLSPPDGADPNEACADDARLALVSALVIAALGASKTR
jgi:hypothetical protein